MAALFDGRYAEGIAPTLEGQQISDEIGNVWGQAYSAEVLGLLYLQLGETAEARESLERAVQLGAQVGFLDALFSGSTFLAFLYGLMGAEPRGIRFLDQIINKYPQHGGWLMGAYVVLAMLYATSGERTQAETALAHGRTLYDGDQTSPFPILMGISEIELALSAGDTQKARQAVDALVEQSLQITLNPFHDLVLIYKGRVQYLQGDLDGASATLSEARELSESRLARLALWRVLAELSKVETARGNAEAARELKQRACEVIRFIAEHAPDDLRATFLARREVRELSCVS